MAGGHDVEGPRYMGNGYKERAACRRPQRGASVKERSACQRAQRGASGLAGDGVTGGWSQVGLHPCPLSPHIQ